MDALQFLIVGKNEEILETLKRLIENTNGWSATISSEENEVLSYLENNPPDALLVSSGLSEAFEKEIIQFVLHLNIKTKVIMHYGGGSGLLKNEIFSAFPQLAT